MGQVSKRKRRMQAINRAAFTLGDDHEDVREWLKAYFKHPIRWFIDDKARGA